MKFHHIGYLTNSLRISTSNFNKLSYKKIGKPIIDNSLKVKIQFLKNRSNIIELIKPNLNNYGLINILKKKITRIILHIKLMILRKRYLN